MNSVVRRVTKRLGMRLAMGTALAGLLPERSPMKQGRASRWLIAAVSTGIAGTVLFGASPASAHDHRAYVVHGDQARGFVHVYDNHRWFAACDLKADGKGVYGRMKLNNGHIIDVNDDNGSAEGCGRVKAPDGTRIVKIEAVWRGGASSGWVDA
jgi:hypothetical protein